MAPMKAMEAVKAANAMKAVKVLKAQAEVKADAVAPMKKSMKAMIDESKKMKAMKAMKAMKKAHADVNAGAASALMKNTVKAGKAMKAMNAMKTLKAVTAHWDRARFTGDGCGMGRTGDVYGPYRVGGIGKNHLWWCFHFDVNMTAAWAGVRGWVWTQRRDFEFIEV